MAGGVQTNRQRHTIPQRSANREIIQTYRWRHPCSMNSPQSGLPKKGNFPSLQTGKHVTGGGRLSVNRAERASERVQQQGSLRRSLAHTRRGNGDNVRGKCRTLQTPMSCSRECKYSRCFVVFVYYLATDFSESGAKWSE